MTRQFRIEGSPGTAGAVEVSVRFEGDRAEVEIGGHRHRLDLSPRPDGTFVGIFETGRVLRSRILPGGRGIRIRTRGRDSVLGLFDPREELAGPASSSGPSEVSAAMPGRVVELRVRQGDRVKSGDLLLILEAMKMQNEIRAEAEAVVASLECEAGQAVEFGAVLLRFESER